jgi:hypothetical protein
MDQLQKLIKSQWMPMVWEHHLQLIMNLILGMAMAAMMLSTSEFDFNRKPASVLTSNCWKYTLRTKLRRGFGGPEVWPSIIWFLNKLPKLAMAKHFDDFKNIQRRQARYAD